MGSDRKLQLCWKRRGGNACAARTSDEGHVCTAGVLISVEAVVILGLGISTWPEECEPISDEVSLVD
jgi:hypothetical protein